MAETDAASYPPPTAFQPYHDNPQPSSDDSMRPPPMQAQHQAPQYQKPHTNIQPLIDSSSGGHLETPTISFSGAKNHSNYMDDFSNHESISHSSLSSTTRNFNLRYQLFLDKISPHWKARWTFSMIALMVFMARVVISQGCPRVDPSLSVDEDDDDAGPMLPTAANDEFKPFIRRVPEFKFWISGTKATLIALVMTLFSVFDVPVFWPILLIYFIILFACTMRQQIKHMIRYSYVPWDSGKKKYAASSNDNSSPTTV